MIDVGGESTRPGHERISDQEEISRVVPVIEALRRRFDIPLSLDTYKSAVAQEGLRAGAGLLNDIWGLADDEKLGKIVADANAAYCLMHNRRHPKPHLTPRRLVLELEEDIKRAWFLRNRPGQNHSGSGDRICKNTRGKSYGDGQFGPAAADGVSRSFGSFAKILH